MALNIGVRSSHQCLDYKSRVFSFSLNKVAWINSISIRIVHSWSISFSFSFWLIHNYSLKLCAPWMQVAIVGLV